ncbi:MAG: HD family hydrolase [Pyrinomonadaceae bacterium]
MALEEGRRRFSILMIETLLELQRLKQLDRTGWTLRGQTAGAESVAAHTYGVCVVAMLLADELVRRGATVNVERVLRLALVHDWAEARLGDMPRTGSLYFGGDARRDAERAAFDDIVKSLGTANEKFYGELHEDYETRASLEARLVKAADVIDLLLQALTFERAGVRGLDEFWENVAERNLLLEGAAQDLVGEILRELAVAHAKAVAAG